MTESNDITQKSAMGIVVIIIALALLMQYYLKVYIFNTIVLFWVFLVLNLRHWKTQTYKIRVSVSESSYNFELIFFVDQDKNISIYY